MQIRNCKRFTVEWIFLGLSLFAFLGTLGITIERLVAFSLNVSNKSEPNNDDLPDCEGWTCLADVTFTVVLIVNLSKSGA